MICHDDFEDAKLVNGCSRGSLVDDKGEEEAPLYNLVLRKKRNTEKSGQLSLLIHWVG